MSERQVEAIARGLLGDDVRVRHLPGERDRNARVTAAGTTYALKVHPPDADRALLDSQDSVLDHLARGGLTFATPRLVRREEIDGYPVRLLTWVPGRPWNGHPRPDRFGLGRMAGLVDRRLASMPHMSPVAADRWRMPRAADTLARHAGLPANLRRYVRETAETFVTSVLPALEALPTQVIHNDGNELNLLVADDGSPSGVIDVGDVDVAPRVCGVAVMATYAMLESDDPLAGAVPFVVGYHRAHTLAPEEIALLPGLIRTRLAMSIVNAAEQSVATPDNAALTSSQAAIRRFLPRVDDLLDGFAAALFRHGCGYAPVANAREVVRWLASAEADPHPVLPGVGPGTRVVPVTPEDLDPDAPGGIDGVLVAGGYGADRDVYTAPAFATPEGERRTVHLGIDVMAPAGTPVSAPFAGTVEQVDVRRSPLDYGGALLVRSTTAEGSPFWLLFGHLRPDVEQRWRAGDSVERGRTLGEIGDAHENGGWAPHLHLQLLTEHFGRGLAVPGVARASQRATWLTVCPDPAPVLGLPPARVATPEGSPEALRASRRAHLSPVLSLSYAQPLTIVGGSGAELIAADGRRYLDLVNNVAHVGHSHPRVVAALAEQAGRLNTNTRYLHPAIVEYTDRLAALFPDPLSTVFLVNSGSEANDLALRIARAHVGTRRTLALEHGYHGNLSSLIDVSHYKCCGPGGEGPGPGVRFAPLPGGLRGATVEEALSVVDAAAAEGAVTFVHETISGVAGQVEVADGFLTAAYARVRDAGGVTIADEVQTGFGRMGDAWWSFERHGVVPDIVTMGKPIGNGHPLAAVICRPDVAASFETGMEYFNTFGGNPVSARVGLAVLDVLRDERLLASATVVGGHFLALLEDLRAHHDAVGDVRGRGLFLGVELVRDREAATPDTALAARVIEHAVRRGVLLSVDGPDHNVLKIKPPLCLTHAQVERAVAVIREALDGS